MSELAIGGLFFICGLVVCWIYLFLAQPLEDEPDIDDLQ